MQYHWETEEGIYVYVCQYLYKGGQLPVVSMQLMGMFRLVSFLARFVELICSQPLS